MIAVGVDIGTRRYHAVALDFNGHDEPYYFASWTHEVDKQQERWRELDDIYQQFYADLRPRVLDSSAVVVYIEDPVVGRGGAKVQGDLARAQAAMMLAAAHANEWVPVSTYTIHLSSWKKEVVGKGNASKADVAEFVRETWPEFAADHDEQDYLDARCIAQYAALVTQRAQALNIAEMLEDT